LDDHSNGGVVIAVLDAGSGRVGAEGVPQSFVFVTERSRTA
jgi:hypothetical protein